MGREAAKDVRRDIQKVNRGVRNTAVTNFPPNRTRVNGQVLELQKEVRRGAFKYHDGCSAEHHQLVETILRPDDSASVSHTIVPSKLIVQRSPWGQNAMSTPALNLPSAGLIMSYTNTVEVSTTSAGNAILVWPDMGSPFSDQDWLQVNTSSFNPNILAAAGFQTESLTRPGMPTSSISIGAGIAQVDNRFAVCLGFTVRMMASKLLAQQMQGEILCGHANTWQLTAGDDIEEFVRALDGTRSYMAETLVSDPVCVTIPSPFWHRAKTGATPVNPALGYTSCTDSGANFFMLLGASQSAVEKYTFEIQHRYAYFSNTIPATVPFKPDQDAFECVLACCALDSGKTLSYEEAPGRRQETDAIQHQISQRVQKSSMGTLPEWVVALGQMALPALSKLLAGF